jgi:hypothetical protein
MASDLEVVGMTNDIGQQQWSWTIFRLSDRTLISQVRIFLIWQKLAEFQAEAWLLVAAWFEPFLGMAGWYKQLVQYGKGPPIKAGHPELSPHLETICEIHHIYEDLNVLISHTREKSAAGNSAKPKQYAGRLLFQFRQLFYKRGFFTRRSDFNARKDSIVRLFFSKRKDFSIRLFFSKRKDFSIRLFFSKSKDFSIRLIFSKKQGFLNPLDFF